MYILLLNKLQNNKYFKEFFTPTALKQFKKYLITGFSAFGIEYSLFAFFYKYLFYYYKPNFYLKSYYFTLNIINKYLNFKNFDLDSFRSLYSNFIVYAFVFWFVFFLNRIWAFKSTEKLSKQLLSFGLLFIFNLVVANIILMYFFSDILGINPMFSKIIVMGFMVSWNFILYKKVIYK